MILVCNTSDIFDIPTQVHQGDFVLHLSEGVLRPAETLRTCVVTPQLAICFDQASQLIGSVDDIEGCSTAKIFI